MTTTESREATAVGRVAGSRYLHTVYDWYGNVAGERRSEHRYAYAICKRISNGPDKRPTLRVTRYSNSAKAPGAEFALTVNWADAT